MLSYYQIFWNKWYWQKHAKIVPNFFRGYSWQMKGLKMKCWRYISPGTFFKLSSVENGKQPYIDISVTQILFVIYLQYLALNVCSWWWEVLRNWLRIGSQNRRTLPHLPNDLGHRYCWCCIISYLKQLVPSLKRHNKRFLTLMTNDDA